MNAPIVAAIITNATTALLAIATAVGALVRLGRNRRYERRTRRIEEFQDRSGELREANRDYGRDQIEQAEAAEAREQTAPLILPAGQTQHVDLGPTVSREVDAAQASVYDKVRIAAARVNVSDPVVVDLNRHWRRLSWLHGVSVDEVSADDENQAWEWFNEACAQALDSRTGQLNAKQRAHWKTMLSQVTSTVDDTDPDSAGDAE